MPALRLTALLGSTIVGIATVAIASDDMFDFMPKGGRTLLLEVIGDAELAEIAAMDEDGEAWAAWVLSLSPDMETQEAETLSGYVELNFPLSPDVLAELAKSNDASLLPPDGKDLAIAQCQFCHSLFSGYLMHNRDETGWRGTFKAPFHKEIPMTETERDTFARYSAINMPLKFEDVPPDLRF
ncbi:MAG: hypothetical protein QNJ20_03500 [Paracoccaceae bacterium]|nr:hypothetical protein [Paracoccaceae bacterium]